ncbi:DUF2782 domain-containing protein [Azomonas macrocytogenes]|uniref:DUF2782 domain-containing protein n=1 Tax=Azomonas macrocytogenes TaxID=69962 RepID=A0A839T1I7_AZOMA|nr:DUF2782 domain-containing protein [Azomonas macrocytogenes]MBB3103262.1 hypothetical protein [Azomonas macrocytogenes]
MRALKHLMLVAVLASVQLPAIAQQEQLPSMAPDPQSPGDPDVTIRTEGDRTIEEYRLNGILYAVKVTPTYGKPYFLVRADGDNNFVNSEKPGMLIPAWKIFSW